MTPITLELLFPPEFVQLILGLLFLIALDLVFGVLVAIKLRAFDLKKLGDFYTSSVIPLVLGWTVTEIMLRAAGALGVPLITLIGNLGIAGFYTIAAGSLLGSLFDKAATLKNPVPVPPPVVTVAVTMPTKATPLPTAEVVPTPVAEPVAPLDDASLPRHK